LKERKILLFAFSGLLALFLFLYPSLIEIGTGVAILLFGIINLEQGFTIFTEGPLRTLLRKSTDKLYKSISVGIFSTAILNSSSLVSVLVISFISAGLISLKAGIGVVFGSNIGTTFTGWLIAIFGLKLNISQLAMPMIIFGVLFIFQNLKTIRAWGYILTGLGFLFLGIHFLKIGFESFQVNLQLFDEGASEFIVLITYTGIGILLTILLQSSAATLAIVLTALSVNQISYNEAIALAIGSNIGTTFTAILGSIAANYAGKQVALAHLVFNILTALVALIFIKPLSSLVDIISNFFLIETDNYTLKLAMFHTVFNVLGVILMLPLINILIKWLNKVFQEPKDDIIRAKYLNKYVLNHPQSAIHSLYKETEHLLDLTFEIFAHSINVHRKDILSVEKVGSILEFSKSKIEIEINKVYVRKVKTIYSKIIKYASLIQKENITEEEQETLGNIKHINRMIVEIVKDLQELRKNLILHIDSENVYVKQTYDIFRKRLLRIIRNLFVNVKSYPYQSLETDQVNNQYNIEFDRIKDNILMQREKISSLDDEINEIISDLLSQKLIKSQIASSIWNDCTYVTRIGNNLLAIFDLLYLEKGFFEMEENI